jgi:hypothetical protein
MFSGLYTSPFPSTPPTPNVKFQLIDLIFLKLIITLFFTIMGFKTFARGGMEIFQLEIVGAL